MPIRQPPRTLTLWVLDKIRRDWPDQWFPSDIQRIDKNDSRNVEDDTVEKLDDPRENGYIVADTITDSETQTSADGTPEAEGLVEVTVMGLRDPHTFGTIEDSADFRDIVRNTKAALRTDRRQVHIHEHPATWTDLVLQNAGTTSGDYADYYAETFEAQLTGHY